MDRRQRLLIGGGLVMLGAPLALSVLAPLWTGGLAFAALALADLEDRYPYGAGTTGGLAIVGAVGAVTLLLAVLYDVLLPPAGPALVPVAGAAAALVGSGLVVSAARGGSGTGGADPA